MRLDVRVGSLVQLDYGALIVPGSWECGCGIVVEKTRTSNASTLFWVYWSSGRWSFRIGRDLDVLV